VAVAGDADDEIADLEASFQASPTADDPSDTPGPDPVPTAVACLKAAARTASHAVRNRPQIAAAITEALAASSTAGLTSSPQHHTIPVSVCADDPTTPLPPRTAAAACVPWPSRSPSAAAPSDSPTHERQHHDDGSTRLPR
jgi:hypothetical protein